MDHFRAPGAEHPERKRRMKLFEPFTLKNMTLKNRLVMPPMCMYSALKQDGRITPFHLAHYTARAIGQVGLVIVEATGVTPEGRISNECLGLYEDAQVEGMRHLVDSVHAAGSKIALQINHAGRKSRTNNFPHLAPSAVAYDGHPADFEAMSTLQIDEVVKAFGLAAKRAGDAGFDGLELHAAHGYLIHQFLSPLSNRRSDAYGQDRSLFLRRVADAVAGVWPIEKPLWIRISATDWLEGSVAVRDWVGWLGGLKGKLDMVHVSSGALQKADAHVYPGYMLPLAEEIRSFTGLPVIGVGLIENWQLIIQALEEDRCDLVALGRELLRNPNKFLDMARLYGREDLITPAYARAYLET